MVVVVVVVVVVVIMKTRGRGDEMARTGSVAAGPGSWRGCLGAVGGVAILELFT